jgi:hypothetical protein
MPISAIGVVVLNIRCDPYLGGNGLDSRLVAWLLSVANSKDDTTLSEADSSSTYYYSFCWNYDVIIAATQPYPEPV